MSEEDIRAKLAMIDEKRERAKLLEKIARWPSGVPSEMRANKTRGWFKSIWLGSGETSFGEVTLTREERSELVDWMYEKANRLRREADAISASLEDNR